MPFRVVSDRRLVPLLAAVEVLFWLPLRGLARVARTRGGRDRQHEATRALHGAANDNARPWALGLEAANSNTPRRLA